MPQFDPAIFSPLLVWLGLTFVVFPVIGWGLQVLSPWLLSPSLYAGVLYLTLVPSTVSSPCISAVNCSA